MALPGSDTDRIRGRRGSHAWRVRYPWALALAVGVAIRALPCAAQVPPSGLHDAKVELLYKITKFIEWPRESFSGTADQITIAILGEDDLAVELASKLSTRVVNGRKFFVRCVLNPKDARGSQILFIAASEEKRIPEVLLALQGLSVLTVADTGGFAASGGMVDFVLEEDRVHFQINRERVERARLRISAKLLALARIVHDGS